MTGVYFVVLVGALIFVHELGHFTFAKIFGVKVLKFSLGLGPRVAGITRGDTEYVIGALPLGGFVRMLGESPTDVVAEADRGRAFGEQAIWKRVIIVLAGPLMNLAFPVALYFVVFLGDTELPPSVVGTVFPDHPADGVLLPGDRIIAVDGAEVSTLDELVAEFEGGSGRTFALTVLRDGSEVEVSLSPALREELDFLDVRSEVGRIGTSPVFPIATIGITSPAQPAAAAGLRTFDRIVAVGGRPVDRWLELATILDGNRGSMLTMSYLRPVRLADSLGPLGELHLFEPHVATLTPEGGPGSGLERAGIEHSELYIWRVAAGSVAHRQGLAPGDRILSLDGDPVRRFSTITQRIDAEGAVPHTLVWRRGDQEMSCTLTPSVDRGSDEIGQTYERHGIGIENWAPDVAPDLVPNPSPIRYAMRHALRETRRMLRITATALVRLFQGRISVRTLGGPLSMYEGAGYAAREGPLDFLSFMAFISINLGLLNLLPVPVLDGGQLVFLGIEAVSRRPPSRRLRELASLAGLVVLVLVMVLAFTNDIERQWPAIEAAFQQ